MARTNLTPQRRAYPRTFSLDQDANELLRELCPNSKGMGLLLSELVRKEALERVGRPQLVAALRNETNKID
jgi:hypothetical protein